MTAKGSAQPTECPDDRVRLHEQMLHAQQEALGNLFEGQKANAIGIQGVELLLRESVVKKIEVMCLSITEIRAELKARAQRDLDDEKEKTKRREAFAKEYGDLKSKAEWTHRILSGAIEKLAYTAIGVVIYVILKHAFPGWLP